MADRDDTLKLEIDGNGAQPDTIESRAALDLAASYLDLLERLAAKTQATELQFRGISIFDKCLQLKFHSNYPDVAAAVAIAADRVLRGVEPAPEGVAMALIRTREALERQHALGRRAKVEVREWTSPLEVVGAETGLLPDSVTSLRAVPTRVGGSDPGVRFLSSSETEPFVLSVNEKMAREVGGHLYREIDITAKVRRARAGNILSGRLLEFQPLEAISQTEGADRWLKWLDENGRAWDEIDDFKEQSLGD